MMIVEEIEIPAHYVSGGLRFVLDLHEKAEVQCIYPREGMVFMLIKYPALQVVKDGGAGFNIVKRAFQVVGLCGGATQLRFSDSAKFAGGFDDIELKFNTARSTFMFFEITELTEIKESRPTPSLISDPPKAEPPENPDQA